MKINKQSNVYTIIYIIVLVVVVGAALAFTSISLRERQQANAAADKMSQILASIDIHPSADSIAAAYSTYVTGSFAVDSRGNRIEGVDAFDVDVTAQSKLPVEQRILPVYQCRLADGAVKYVLPMSGTGLWGPIWGYISVDADGTTVYGAYFAHQGETPGLGAEIEKPRFSAQFTGKKLFDSGDIFVPIAVVKGGSDTVANPHAVDGISGGTITSKGVGAMIDNCLTPYSLFLKSL